MKLQTTRKGKVPLDFYLIRKENPLLPAWKVQFLRKTNIRRLCETIRNGRSAKGTRSSPSRLLRLRVLHVRLFRRWSTRHGALTILFDTPTPMPLIIIVSFFISPLLPPSFLFSPPLSCSYNIIFPCLHLSLPFLLSLSSLSKIIVLSSSLFTPYSLLYPLHSPTPPSSSPRAPGSLPAAHPISRSCSLWCRQPLKTREEMKRLCLICLRV